MFGRDSTPPPSSRIFEMSSPDSVYKSSSDSSNNNLSFSPDSTAASSAYKPCFSIPKLYLPPDDQYDSEYDWDPSMASPIRRRPPSIRKASKTKSRLSDGHYNSSTTSCSAEHENTDPLITSPTVTPPHKRLRALRINDMTSISPAVNGSPLRPKRLSPRASLFGSAKKTVRMSPTPSSVKKPSNPFTPVNNCRTIKQTPCESSTTDSGFLLDDSWLHGIGRTCENSMAMQEEKLALREMFTSRYKEEFLEDCILGSGEFGTVFKCVNKLDGCTYAIKRSREPVAGSAFESRARNEVYAHAVLGKHSHVVRYYSAWAENGHLYIQNEYCNGGSLAEEIALHRRRGTRFTESELKDILKQVAQGLKYIHAQQLVHMDIKPGNIFIHFNPQLIQSPESGIEEDSSDCELTDKIVYKIGDFGHVTSLHATELEEGDCRYLPKEILQDSLKNLPKADVFALGLTIYQAAALVDLPKNGEQWHAIRDGRLPALKGYSMTLYSLIKKMVHPDPVIRPAAAMITSHPDLCPTALRSRKQLAQELNEERFKNQMLAKQLKAVQENAELTLCTNAKSDLPTLKNSGRSGRLIGIRVNRSRSLTQF